MTYYSSGSVDKPSFQQYNWSAEKKAALHSFVAKIHASWPIDRDYIVPPSRNPEYRVPG